MKYRKLGRKLPGFEWRTLAWDRKTGDKVEDDSDNYENRVCFDEIVIDDWFHLEQCSDRLWYMRIGNDLLMYIYMKSDGTKRVHLMDEREYDSGMEFTLE